MAWYKLNPPTLRIGNTYETNSGELVKMVRIENAGHDYETMVDEQGRHYYSRSHKRIIGRLMGSGSETSGDIRFYDPPELAQPEHAQSLTASYLQGSTDAKRGTFQAVVRWLEAQCTEVPATGPMLANALRYIGLEALLEGRIVPKPGEPVEYKIKIPTRRPNGKLTLGLHVSSEEAVICLMQHNDDYSLDVLHLATYGKGDYMATLNLKEVT